MHQSELISQVAGKEYHAYRKTALTANRETTLTSRPINSGLFIDDEAAMRVSWRVSWTDEGFVGFVDMGFVDRRSWHFHESSQTSVS
jgi:hypothetical protein